MNQEAW